MHKLPFALLLLIVLGVVSCHRASEHTSPFQASVDSIFEDIFPADEPGAVVLIAKGDSIVYLRGFGLADLDSRTPVTDTTLFNVSSLSKQFSAVALLKLEEDSVLSLDDPLTKFIPKLHGEPYSRVKLHHLLSHTSGIPDMRPRTEEQWATYDNIHHSRFASCRDYKLFALAAESTKYLLDIDSLSFEPGNEYSYSNPPYQLILRVVEAATGRRFMPWMKDNIFDPVELNHTFYYDPAIDHGQLSHGYHPAPDDGNPYGNYRSGDGRWEEYDYGEADFFATKPDGGVYTSARDFFKWEEALYSGKVIGEYALRKAIAPVIDTDDPGISVGLGFFIKEIPGMPMKIYQSGTNGGYMAAAAYMPEVDVHYLIFSNRNNWNRRKAIDALDAVLTANNWLD